MRIYRKRLIALLFSLAILFSTSHVQGNLNNVEILEISNGEITFFENSSDIQALAKNYIHSINKLSVKFNPIPKKGIAIKVPIEPAIEVDNHWINDLISEIIVIYDEHGDALIMLYDDENRSYFFEFTANPKSLYHTFISR